MCMRIIHDQLDMMDFTTCFASPCSTTAFVFANQVVLVFLQHAQIFRLLLKISVEENNSNESLDQLFVALPFGGVPY